MDDAVDRPYRFAAALPVEPVAPGTSLLVAGGTHEGARPLALRLAAPADDEALVVVTTDKSGPRLVDRCGAAVDALDRDRVGVVDCVGDGTDGQGERIEAISGPSDLTGIGMHYSSLYGTFHGEGTDRVRSVFDSLSTMLLFGDTHTVGRFVHTITSRIDTAGGLGVFVIDPSIHDEREVDTIARFCDGRIDVREGADGPELHVRGLPGQPREWTPFDVD